MTICKSQPRCRFLSFAIASITRLPANPCCSISHAHARICARVGGSAYKLVIGCFHRRSFWSGDTQKLRLRNSKELGLPFPCETYDDA